MGSLSVHRRPLLSHLGKPLYRHILEIRPRIKLTATIRRIRIHHRAVRRGQVSRFPAGAFSYRIRTKPFLWSPNATGDAQKGRDKGGQVNVQNRWGLADPMPADVGALLKAVAHKAA